MLLIHRRTYLNYRTTDCWKRMRISAVLSIQIVGTAQCLPTRIYHPGVVASTIHHLITTTRLYARRVNQMQGMVSFIKRKMVCEKRSFFQVTEILSQKRAWAHTGPHGPTLRPHPPEPPLPHPPPSSRTPTPHVGTAFYDCDRKCSTDILCSH